MDEATLALRIARRLKPQAGDNFGVFTADTILDIYHSATNGIFAVLVGVVGLSLVVGGIVIMNIMLMVVTERTREIGLRKALGARRSRHHGADPHRVGRAVDVRRRHRHACSARRSRRRSRAFTPIPASVELWSVALGIGITAMVGPVLRPVSGDARGAARSRSKRCEESDSENENIAMAIRLALFWEVIAMAFDTVRTQQDALGADRPRRRHRDHLDRRHDGDDPRLRSVAARADRAARPRHDHHVALQRHEFRERRRVQDADEAAEPDDLGQPRDRGAGAAAEDGGRRARRRRPRQRRCTRVFFRDQRTKPIIVIGTSEYFQDGTNIPFLGGRFFNGTEVQYRKNVVVLGNTAYKLLFEPAGIDPIGKTVRVGPERFEVVGVYDKRAAGGFGSGADDFAVIPYTAYQRIFGLQAGPLRAQRRRCCRCRSRCSRATASR